jgi:hypothetical protein
MSANGLMKYSPTCPDGRDGEVVDYCFGDMGDHGRAEFEAHLLGCEVCWDGALRLAPAVELIRGDKSLTKTFTDVDVLMTTGVSSRLQRLFGGHLWQVLVGCSLYAALYSVAVVLEVSYQFERYYPGVIFLAPAVFAWVALTSALGLGADWKATLGGRAMGLIFSTATFVSAALILYLALGLYLPNRPITEANFPAYPAHGAFLKDTLYFLPLAVVFLVIPYHFVVTLQRELREGRYRLGMALFMNERWSVVPGGSVYLRVWWLCLTLSGAFVVSLALTSHLFENLKPGTHSDLFVQLVQWRLVIYFTFGAECLLWYYHLLNEIKRECLAGISAQESRRSV